MSRRGGYQAHAAVLGGARRHRRGRGRRDVWGCLSAGRHSDERRRSDERDRRAGRCARGRCAHARCARGRPRDGGCLPGERGGAAPGAGPLDVAADAGRDGGTPPRPDAHCVSRSDPDPGRRQPAQPEQRAAGAVARRGLRSPRPRGRRGRPRSPDHGPPGFSSTPRAARTTSARHRWWTRRGATWRSRRRTACTRRGFAANIEYVPGYHDGKQPYGVWPVETITVASGWKLSHDPDLDFAFLTLASAGGRQIQARTGGLTIGFTRWYSEKIEAIGHNDSDAEPVRCATKSFRFRTGQMEFYCHGFWTGTSGGPWIIGYNAKNGTGTVFGVIGGYELGGDYEWASYSAYFGSAARTLYQQAERQATPPTPTPTPTSPAADEATHGDAATAPPPATPTSAPTPPRPGRLPRTRRRPRQPHRTRRHRWPRRRRRRARSAAPTGLPSSSARPARPARGRTRAVSYAIDRKRNLSATPATAPINVAGVADRSQIRLPTPSTGPPKPSCRRVQAGGGPGRIGRGAMTVCRWGRRFPPSTSSWGEGGTPRPEGNTLTSLSGRARCAW